MSSFLAMMAVRWGKMRPSMRMSSMLPSASTSDEGSPLVVGNDNSTLGLAIVGGSQAIEVLLTLDDDLDADERVTEFVERTCNIIVDIEALALARQQHLSPPDQ